MKMVLDTATAIYARRPLALLFCSALSLVPMTLATGAFMSQVLAPERPSPFGLLGVGILSAAAWLTFCWGQAASVRVCHSEFTDFPLTLGEGIRRGLEDVPRVMVASASRLVILVIGAMPLGAGLPHAAAWTSGLVPAAVLDGAGPREGLGRAKRAPRAHAYAQVLPWGLFPVVWINLVLAYAGLLGWLVRIDPGHLEAALRDGPALIILAAVAWWLVDPLRAAASVAAYNAWQCQVRGHDLVRVARAALAVLFCAMAWPGEVRAQVISPEAWSAYLWEARESVIADNPGAPDQVLTLLGREVEVADDQALMVTDRTLARLSQRLESGDQSAVVDVLHHLMVLEHFSKTLERSSTLEGSWPGSLPPARTLTSGNVQSLRSALEAMGQSAGRVQSWAETGSMANPKILGSNSMLASGLAAVALGLGWLFLVGGKLDRPPVARRPDVTSLGSPLPQGLQGTAKAAVRQGFLAILRALEDSGQVDDVANLTNGEVARQLDGVLWERFRRAADAYENAWYGGLPAGESELLAVEEALAAARGRGL
jgi:hypothetical protein